MTTLFVASAIGVIAALALPTVFRLLGWKRSA